MKGYECTFIKEGVKQNYYFYGAGRKKDDSFYKAWVEEIYGPVTDFTMELIK